MAQATRNNLIRPLATDAQRRGTRPAQVAALALTLAAGTAFAADLADAAAAPPVVTAQAAASPAQTAGKEERVKQLGTLIVMGAVAEPGDAHWVDDSTLPELPMTEAEAQPALVASAAD